MGGALRRERDFAYRDMKLKQYMYAHHALDFEYCKLYLRPRGLTVAACKPKAIANGRCVNTTFVFES